MNSGNKVQNTGMMKKHTAAIAVILAVLVCVALFAGRSHYAAMAASYDTAVACIVAGDYDKAGETLEKVDHEDSDALQEYAELQSDLESYKGEPDELLEQMESVEGIENEEVQQDYEKACEEVKLAEDIQEEIDDLDTESAESVDEEKVSLIEKLREKLTERYDDLLDTEKYDRAVKLLEDAERQS